MLSLRKPSKRAGNRVTRSKRNSEADIVGLCDYEAGGAVGAAAGACERDAGAGGAAACARAGVAAGASGTSQCSPGAGFVILYRFRSAWTLSLGWAPTDSQ